MSVATFLALATLILFVSWRYYRSGDDAEQIALLIDVSEPDSRVTPEPNSHSRRWMQFAYWIAGGACLSGFRYAVTGGYGIELMVFAALGGIAGEMVWRSVVRARVRANVRSLEFNLPMVMEQIVMAASAGLDVLPAIQEASRHRSDPVSVLLARISHLCESGVGLEDAIRTVLKSVPCPAVKHAFVHIALAHKEGGEIVRPLRELSDATQSFYQETVEEEIARLPVKAVLPLVITFAGLIICFLTVPLVQVGSITSKVTRVEQKP